MPKIGDAIKVSEAEGKPFYSFEYFPPKTPAGVMNLYERVERMAKLEPMFVDITWGAGGSTTDLTLELSANFQQQFCCETQMHLTCTNIDEATVIEALHKAKASGITNILALRGDPPAGTDKWEATEGGCNNAVDLCKLIRREHGDYFGIAVAGYPEGHIDHFKDLPECPPEAYKLDLQYLKDKVDAGADVIITQLFYDVDQYLKWVQDCRDIGIKCPIVPGIMPINTYGGFNRMTGFCKTTVPPAMRAGLDAVQEDDAAVKAFGVQYVTDMCKKLMDSGAPGLHLYTLNQETAVIEILESLNLLKDTATRRAMPWKQRIDTERAPEDVRPVYWANRPRSYMARTLAWKQYPNGRWGDTPRVPAFAPLEKYHLEQLHTVDEESRRTAYGSELKTVSDVASIFAKFVSNETRRLPWCCRLEEESKSTGVDTQLLNVNRAGFMTINSQPRVNACSSVDDVHGWGGPGGVVFQKGYVEFFCSPAHLEAVKGALAAHPSVQYMATNEKGEAHTNCKNESMALTWGVFPDREIVQPTVMDKQSFKVWKEEAFALGDRSGSRCTRRAPRPRRSSRRSSPSTSSCRSWTTTSSTATSSTSSTPPPPSSAPSRPA